MKRYNWIILCGFLGIALQLYFYGINMLTYYTILSNLLVTVGYIIVQRAAQPLSTNMIRFKGALTMGIMLTCLVYHFMLAPLKEPHEHYNIQNFLVHYIVPLSVLVDCVVFDKSRVYRWFDPFLWMLVPLAYSVFGILNGLVFGISVPGSPDSPFPYFFLNVKTYGFIGVLQNSFGLMLAYIVLSYVLVGIKSIPWRKR